MMASRVWRAAIATALMAGGASAEVEPATMLDRFENPLRWTPHPADGVEMKLTGDVGVEGGSLRVDYTFTGGGYAVIRRTFDLTLPENYAFSFRIRGDGPPNHIEFKLIDASGDNVWWNVRRDVTFSGEWETFTIKKRQIQFAWGPAAGGELNRVAAMEIVVTAGSGGTGTIWLDDLELQPREVTPAFPPLVRVRASSARAGEDASRVADDDPHTTWSPRAEDAEPSITLDFERLTEFGGLVIDWAPGRHAVDYILEGTDDGVAWRNLRSVNGSNGGRDFHYLPESECRALRLRIPSRSKPPDVAIAEATLEPLEWSASRNTFFRAVADGSPRGDYPRGITGEQSYWTVIGVDGDAREGLINEDGMVETGPGRFSLEPLLFAGWPSPNARLLTWADARSEASLDGGHLPIPSVSWEFDDAALPESATDLGLTVTAFGTGSAGASSMVVRYRVTNRGEQPRSANLIVAVRPFQVNPPSQSLNRVGGVATVREIEVDGRTIRVDGRPAVYGIGPLPDVRVVAFDAGNVVERLRQGIGDAPSSLSDPFGATEAALMFPVRLEPGAEMVVALAIPLHDESPPPPPDAGPEWVQDALEACRDEWRTHMDRVTLQFPEVAAPVLETLKSQLGYILVNRAGPRIQPGARSYARSWIRDGALTSSALLRLGHADVVREYVDWVAPFQYANGKVPCVVDDRGADPVPEHDSSGEFIFLVAETYRYTRDRELAQRHWPGVLRAAAYLDSLRNERRTDAYRSPERAHFFGILPPSISHEGYSAKPMHSYWDDLFALRGFKDAVYLAGELGHDDHRAHLVAVRDQFEHDLAASVVAAMRHHGIDYVPGCADLGDFDPTATTILFSPVDAADILPPAAVSRTFERYDEFFEERRSGAPWDAYTPYEIRNVGAFIRLGWRKRAHELLGFFFAHQRPLGWRHWAEVVGHDSRSPRFIGDMPHTWVGSDYIRSVLDMLAYTRERDDALVVGAGIPRKWLVDTTGVAVTDLPTPYGALSYRMREREGAIEVRIDAGVDMPTGGIVVRPPTSGPTRATVNGAPAPSSPEGGIVVRELPAVVVIEG